MTQNRKSWDFSSRLAFRRWELIYVGLEAKPFFRNFSRVSYNLWGLRKGWNTSVIWSWRTWTNFFNREICFHMTILSLIIFKLHSKFELLRMTSPHLEAPQDFQLTRRGPVRQLACDPDSISSWLDVAMRFNERRCLRGRFGSTNGPIKLVFTSPNSIYFKSV